MNCSVEGCLNQHKAKTYCSLHYARFRRSSRPIGLDTQVCIFSSCVSVISRRYLICEKHKRWMWTYGITIEQMENLFSSPICNICFVDLDLLDSMNWAVDHDHKCCDKNKQWCGNCIRGLLCRGCNLMLGAARDNPTTLRAAADYLEKFSETS